MVDYDTAAAAANDGTLVESASQMPSAFAVADHGFERDTTAGTGTTTTTTKPIPINGGIRRSPSQAELFLKHKAEADGRDYALLCRIMKGVESYQQRAEHVKSHSYRIPQPMISAVTIPRTAARLRHSAEQNAFWHDSAYDDLSSRDRTLRSMEAAATILRRELSLDDEDDHGTFHSESTTDNDSDTANDSDDYDDGIFNMEL